MGYVPPERQPQKTQTEADEEVSLDTLDVSNSNEISKIYLHACDISFIVYF